MCLYKDKWPKPATTLEEMKKNTEYLNAIRNIETLNQVVQFISQTERKEDEKDYWQAPYETYSKKTYDCEDLAIMTADILERNFLGEKVAEVYFIIYEGYYKKEEKVKRTAHAVTLFYYTGDYIHKKGYYEFTNQTLRFAFDPEESNFIKYGYKHYPLGLKSFEQRTAKGKIIERKRAWIGYLK